MWIYNSRIVNRSFLLDDLRLFCLAARQASFLAAAKEMGVSPALVSKRIAILEKALGVKLFHRSARRVSVTADGEAVYRSAQEIFAGVERMEDMLAGARAEPRGRLAITTRARLARDHVGPILSELARRHPALGITLDVVDHPVDLVGEGGDIDIRIGEVLEPNVIAHRLAASRRVLSAAPAYLERCGAPASLAELAQHACLVLRERKQSFGVWRLHGPNGLETAKVTGPMSSNDADIIRRWAHGGHGIALNADWDVGASLAAGALVRVLPAYSQPADVWAVTTARLSHSAKVRVCVEFLREQLAEGPYALFKPGG